MCFYLISSAALVVAYDFHPYSQTLSDLHFKKNSYHNNGRSHSERIPEATLWSYIYQIASAIKAIHDVGLAVRVVDASKILMTGKNRYASNKIVMSSLDGIFYNIE